MFLCLLAPVASDLLIGDALKNHKGGYLEVFTICFLPNMETVAKLGVQPFTRGRNCDFLIHVIMAVLLFSDESSY